MNPERFRTAPVRPRISRTIALAATLLAASGPRAARAELPADLPPLEARGVRFCEAFLGEDFDALLPFMDEAMTAAMPPDSAAAIRRGLAAQVGDFVAFDSVRVEPRGAWRAVVVASRFERATLDLQVVFDAAERVSGFFMRPSAPAVAWKPPPYADAAAFSEEETEVVEGGFRLPATLAVPAGCDGCPVVVLVHGSGPNDRDETIGGSKPFKDLAWGLATRGVAVLRYEKRTKAHAGRLDVESLTLEEETAADARAAVRALAADGRFGRVAVAGHSLGGYAGPRIANGLAELAGLAILAGSNRPLEAMMVEQMEYIFGADGALDERERGEIEKIRDAFRRTRAGERTAELGGASRAYLEDMDAYDPLATAAGLPIPIFVAQGGRDYQVLATKDFENWKRALADKPDATFRLYPALDHLFVSGEGPSLPADYLQSRNVAEELVADLAEWAKGLR